MHTQKRAQIKHRKKFCWNTRKQHKQQNTITKPKHNQLQKMALLISTLKPQFQCPLLIDRTLQITLNFSTLFTKVKYVYSESKRLWITNTYAYEAWNCMCELIVGYHIKIWVWRRWWVAALKNVLIRVKGDWRGCDAGSHGNRFLSFLFFSRRCSKNVAQSHVIWSRKCINSSLISMQCSFLVSSVDAGVSHI